MSNSALDLWRGPNLKFQVFQLGMIGIIFLILYDLWLGILTMGLYWLAFQYYLVNTRAQAKEKHEGERTLDVKIMREKDYREDKLLCFLHYKKIDRASKIPAIKDFPEYKEAQYFVLKKRELHGINFPTMPPLEAPKPEIADTKPAQPGKTPQITNPKGEKKDGKKD